MSLFNPDSAFRQEAKRMAEAHIEKEAAMPPAATPDLEAIYTNLNEALQLTEDQRIQRLIEDARDEVYRYLR